MTRAAGRDVYLTVLSDTHQLHRELDRLPGGDLLIHCGDFSFFSRSNAAIEDFASWMSEQPYRHKVVCFGNHEFAFEAEPHRKSVFEERNVLVLVNEGAEINGLKLWASPVTPLYGGAFGLSSAMDRAKHWASVPANTDILITHGPPYRILDRSPGHPENQGDPELLAAVEHVRPILHCFGHVHGGHGVSQQGDTTFINAALLGLDGSLTNEAVNVRLPNRMVPTKDIQLRLI